jgi:glutathione synthase/RimK-type ligase-like ATP-grasp enzyme
MNKLWVLAKNFDTYFMRRLTEEVGQDHLRYFNPWTEQLNEVVAQPVLVRSSGVYGSELDLLTLEQHFAGPIFNPLTAQKIFRSKKTQYQALQALGVPVLPWLDLQSASWQELQQFVQLIAAREWLIKPHRGQGGWGIKTLSLDDLQRWWEQAVDREYLLQPYLRAQRELRYFFIHQDWEYCLSRTGGQTGPAANFAQGGAAQAVDLPIALRPFIQLLGQSGLLYGAMDILEQHGAFYFLDINLVPGVEQLEAISGHNILKSLARRLLS